MTASGVDLSELRRHASVGRARRGPFDRPGGLPHHFAAKSRRPLPDLYVADQAEARRGGRFRWFFSTCLAAAVGAIAIAAVIFGSLEGGDPSGKLIATLRQAARPFSPPIVPKTAPNPDGLAWATPKQSRLQTTMDAVSTRYIVQEAIQQRRANRDYLHHRPFARVVIRLPAVRPDTNVTIPAFNPLKLFSSTSSSPSGSGSGGTTGPEGGELSARVVELLGSILPAEDGLDMDDTEVGELIIRAGDSEATTALIRPSFAPEGLGRTALATGLRPTANTTILAKTNVEQDQLDEETEAQSARETIKRGDSLTRLLDRMGVDAWQAREMVATARRLLPPSASLPGHEVELTTVPPLSGTGRPEPLRFSLFAADSKHVVTVERNAAGEFVASEEAPAAAATSKGEAANASIYASLYYGALEQKIDPDVIRTILKTHASDADFRRRARGSDSAELFFDLVEGEKGSEGTLGDLLMTSLTLAGETQRFYRFKPSEGPVDYFDATGNNSRKFLLRKPVRGDAVRLTSGFGIRFHPLLNRRKMHSGVDWAGPPGTPIVAAANGVIEEAGYKGQYGNYIRIRHANSYQSAYGHMRNLAKGIRKGSRVRQGRVIGYIGSTGLSSGPHLHFEVLVGKRLVDPLSIRVPREKTLTGRDLAAFQRERVRIDQLMRRTPVTIKNIESRQ